MHRREVLAIKYCFSGPAWRARATLEVVAVQLQLLCCELIFPLFFDVLGVSSTLYPFVAAYRRMCQPYFVLVYA